MATNAKLVVLFQCAVIRAGAPHRPLNVLALGALFNSLGAGSVALAPADMRGCYMGLYGLTWGVSFGIAPVIGGWLNDNVTPAAIWHAGLAMGSAAALGFLLLDRRLHTPRIAPPVR